jgi:hypothetical protein
MAKSVLAFILLEGIATKKSTLMAVGGIVLMIVWAMFGSLILGEGDER